MLVFFPFKCVTLHVERKINQYNQSLSNILAFLISKLTSGIFEDFILVYKESFGYFSHEKFIVTFYSVFFIRIIILQVISL